MSDKIKIPPKPTWTLEIMIDHDKREGQIQYDPSKVDPDDVMKIGNRYFVNGYRIVIYKFWHTSPDFVMDWE